MALPPQFVSRHLFLYGVLSSTLRLERAYVRYQVYIRSILDSTETTSPRNALSQPPAFHTSRTDDLYDLYDLFLLPGLDLSSQIDS